MRAKMRSRPCHAISSRHIQDSTYGRKTDRLPAATGPVLHHTWHHMGLELAVERESAQEVGAGQHSCVLVEVKGSHVRSVSRREGPRRSCPPRSAALSFRVWARTKFVEVARRSATATARVVVVVRWGWREASHHEMRRKRSPLGRAGTPQRGRRDISFRACRM